MSLFRNGAVGARMIQASAHVRFNVGGAAKLLPSAFDLVSIQVGGDFLHRGGGFARDDTKPAEFLAPLTAFFIQ